MDQCGEASAVTKLASLSLQDRSLLTAKRTLNAASMATAAAGHEKAEYFEFSNDAPTAHGTWLQEFSKSKGSDLLDSKLAMQFENVFTNSGANRLVNDFKTSEKPQIVNSDFEKFNRIFDSIADKESWTREFSRHEINNNNNSNIDNNSQQWAEEFVEKDGEAEETARSAQILLESLDLSDPKLARSKFVSYLKELTENDPTVNGTYDWDQEYRRNIEAAGLTADPEDDQWRNLEKAWEKYSFSGQGYEQFAPREYSQYRYSLDDGLNPFHGLGSGEIFFQLADLKASSLSKYILALEELTRLRPDDAVNWMNLGLAQAENELDVQAISAFYRAVHLDSKLNHAWLGLGAACVNEYCIPDALDAFKTIAFNFEPSLSFDSSNLLSSLTSIFRNASLIPDEALRVGVLSILLNVAGQFDEAITLLQNSTSSLRNNYSLWNRLGATLANSQRYEQALQAYERSLTLNPTYVRALYNMGVSYMNQSNYPKSLGFMIRSLQYHLPVDTQIDSDVLSEALKTGYNTIWNTMRIVGDMWGREDVNLLIEERNLPSLMNALKDVL